MWQFLCLLCVFTWLGYNYEVDPRGDLLPLVYAHLLRDGKYNDLHCIASKIGDLVPDLRRILIKVSLGQHNKNILRKWPLAFLSCENFISYFCKSTA